MKKILFISKKTDEIEIHKNYLKNKEFEISTVKSFDHNEIFELIKNSDIIISDVYIDGQDLGSLLPKYSSLVKKPLVIGLCEKPYSFDALYALKIGASLIFNPNKSPKFLLAQVEALTRLSKHFSGLTSNDNTDQLLFT